MDTRLSALAVLAAMKGSLLQFCSIFRRPSIWTLRPRVAGTLESDSQVVLPAQLGAPCSLCYLFFLCSLCNDGQRAALGSYSASQAATTALVGGDTSSSRSLLTNTATTARERRRWCERQREGRERDVPRTTGDRRPCLRGRGRRLRLRWPGRWFCQPRSITRLPGPSPRGVVPAWRRRRGRHRCQEPSSSLQKKKEQEEKQRKAGVRPAGGGVAPGVLGARSGAPWVKEEE